MNRKVMLWYKAILKTADWVMVRLVDQYNAGGLPPNCRLAMEIIDGLPMSD